MLNNPAPPKKRLSPLRPDVPHECRSQPPMQRLTRQGKRRQHASEANGQGIHIAHHKPRCATLWAAIVDHQGIDQSNSVVLEDGEVTGRADVDRDLAAHEPLGWVAAGWLKPRPRAFQGLMGEVWRKATPPANDRGAPCYSQRF